MQLLPVPTHTPPSAPPSEPRICWVDASTAAAFTQVGQGQGPCARPAGHAPAGLVGHTTAPDRGRHLRCRHAHHERRQGPQEGLQTGARPGGSRAVRLPCERSPNEFQPLRPRASWLRCRWAGRSVVSVVTIGGPHAVLCGAEVLSTLHTAHFTQLKLYLYRLPIYCSCVT